VEPKKTLVKRIIALGGDVVRTNYPYGDMFAKVPKGRCWVEGDESFHSLDSNTFGPVRA
jgi:inner membrane protease subunit 2